MLLSNFIVIQFIIVMLYIKFGNNNLHLATHCKSGNATTVTECYNSTSIHLPLLQNYHSVLVALPRYLFSHPPSPNYQYLSDIKLNLGGYITCYQVAYSRSYWNLLETTGRYFLPDIKGRLLLKHTATGLLHCKSGNATSTE